jgi:DNA-directed RNA polymerase specialized sigma24 family protein
MLAGQVTDSQEMEAEVHFVLPEGGMRRQRATEAQTALYHLFEEHSSELYWLAFLLTGDREQSVQAFTRAFELENGANPVFRQFMVSWARKLVIAASLATIETELRESACRTADTDDQDSAQLAGPLLSHAWMGDGHMTKLELERAVLAIDAFPRCALLLTVFEHLSIEDAASLLNTDEAALKLAQSAGFIQLTRNIASGRGWRPATSSNIALSEEYAPARI